MIGSFKFNNTESSTYELVCKSVKRPLLPAVNVNRTEIMGASGVYDFSDHEFALRPITMRIIYIGKSYEELRTRARSIAAWLSTSAWSKLIINDEDDKYYMAKVTNEIDLESLWEAGTAEIQFDCQPFAYSVDESIFSFLAVAETPYEFENLGTRMINYKSPQGSKFVIEVEGTWTSLSLSINGKSLTYPVAVAVSDILVIDSIELEVELGGTNVFGDLTGDIDDFFTLLPGDNTLTVSGTAIDVEVTIKFIELWL